MDLVFLRPLCAGQNWTRLPEGKKKKESWLHVDTLMMEQKTVLGTKLHGVVCVAGREEQRSDE